jgi:hypothetical protein
MALTWRYAVLAAVVLPVPRLRHQRLQQQDGTARGQHLPAAHTAQATEFI